ncbi:hypothetical protein PanWU01x14_012710, partial [Parasponia andersonii]
KVPENLSKPGTFYGFRDIMINCISLGVGILAISLASSIDKDGITSSSRSLGTAMAFSEKVEDNVGLLV